MRVASDNKLQIQICECLPFTFKPLARLIALRGLSTLNTLRIFTTEMALDLQHAADTHNTLRLSKTQQKYSIAVCRTHQPVAVYYHRANKYPIPFLFF